MVSTYPFFLGYLDALLHVFLDAGVGAEITVYQFLGLRTRDAQTLGEPEDGDAVNDTEVGGFRLPAHIAGYFFYRDSVDLGGCGGVDIRSRFGKPRSYAGHRSGGP